MNPTLVLSSLVLLIVLVAIGLEIAQLLGISRSRRIVVRSIIGDEAGPEITLPPAGTGAGAFAGSPVSITGPARDPIPAIARRAEPAPAATSTGSRRAVYDFVPPPPRKSRTRNVHV